MANYPIPGVYVEEISTFPPAVAAVETALPAFLGYTAFRRNAAGADLGQTTPQRIGSLLEFEARYGRGATPTVSSVELDEAGAFLRASVSQRFYLYDAVRLFYANGGGDCFIVSLANGFPANPAVADFTAGLAASIPEPADPADFNAYYGLADQILTHCRTLGDRFGVLDLLANDLTGTNFRNQTGTNGLKYGAAYTPWLEAALPKTLFANDFGNVFGRRGAGAGLGLTAVLTDVAPALVTAVAAAPTPEARQDAENDLLQSSGIYKGIMRGLNATSVAVPPSGAVVGLYAETDRNRGVWKAPANVSINGVGRPSRAFTESELGNLNVDVTSGKSINAIRFFTGRGTLVYGARTLAGNDGEYRYVNVRRLMNMLEESVKKATEQFVFEPNDANTWVRVRGMIENFLTLLWRDGALQGARPDHAFGVAIGLGQTMTAQDVVDGRMIVEIAVAPVRPAEFIILRFMQHLPTS